MVFFMDSLDHVTSRIPRPRHGCKVVLGAGIFSLSLAAAAFEDRSSGLYFESGHAFRSESHADVVTLGAVVPWTPSSSFESGASSLYLDFFVSQWRAPLPTGSEHRSYTQAGAIANWRYRLDQGASPWFVEVGLGGTLMDSLYRTVDREFSTRFQFTEQFSVGRSFGSQGRHEVSIRFQHFSNAGIKSPNPGENFFRVRYIFHF